MRQNNNIVGSKLNELGKTLGLENSDIAMAKMTMRTMMGMVIISGIITLLGKILCSQLDPSGLYYLVPSSINTGVLGRFF